jgi:hypothetical protein
VASGRQMIPAFTGTLPSFPAYSPTSSIGLFTFAQNFRPAVCQHYAMNLQIGFTPQSVLEVGYMGTRGTHLTVVNSPNQALLASAGAPIRGQTDNTVANVAMRVPVEGLDPESFEEISSSGASWYNAMLANYTHRFGDGSQAQAAYTWARILVDSAGISTGPKGGTVLETALPAIGVELNFDHGPLDGRKIVKTAPDPGWLINLISPLWAWTMARAIGSPIPVPEATAAWAL